MALDTLHNHIDVKHLALDQLENGPKGRFEVSPKDVDWDRMKLDIKRGAYSEALRLAAYIKYLFPEKGTEIFDLIKTPDEPRPSMSLTMKSELALLVPEWKSQLASSVNDFKLSAKTTNITAGSLRWLLHEAVAYKILRPNDVRLQPPNVFPEEVWQEIKRVVERPLYELTVIAAIFADIKLLNPQFYTQLQWQDSYLEELENALRNFKADKLNSLKDLEFAFNLKVIAAPEARITDNGYEFSQEFVHAGKSTLPEQRNF